MSTARRIVTLIAVVAGLMLVSGAAAQASLSDSVPVTATPLTISTATVAAPANGPGSLTCRNNNAVMGLTWTRSTSARVTGYVVNVRFSDGVVQYVNMSATATSWSQSINLYNVTVYSVRYSVTTVTEHGWTAESASTGWFRC